MQLTLYLFAGVWKSLTTVPQTFVDVGEEPEVAESVIETGAVEVGSIAS